ncbi:CU044_5270 family protein [Spirillospora sp. CA-294931]|uniref:CU044_5270 family protein n=1 Tax=Spirillospora sp. CA-294931 TaxID=3240042 RepID=UPI003D8F7B39
MNNDVQEVRTILAPTNPVPPGTLAGAAHEPAARAARDRIIASDERPRRRRWTPRLVAVGGLAVTIAAGTTVAQNIGGTDEHGRPRTAIPGLPAAPAANAKEALTRAAYAAERRPFTAPRPDQWVYIKTRYKDVNHKKKKYGPFTPKSPATTYTQERWTRADGKQTADFEGGKLVIAPTGGTSIPNDYATVSTLPRDPDALLAWAKKQAGPHQDPVFSLLGAMLVHSLVPPAQEAAIYRALAKTPGVTLTKRTSDAEGRPALSLSSAAEGWIREEVLLDPSTYAYRGHRTVVIKDHSDEHMSYKKGTVADQSARLTITVVNRPGQRPHS